MKILTVANQKGGVGKTTFALHLTYLAQELGKRVLLVEFDPQRNASNSFVTEPGEYLVASDLFALHMPEKKPETTSGIGLIRATLKFAEIASGQDKPIQPLPAANLRKLASDYDLCVIDTPPAIGNGQLAALIAADYVVAPVRMDDYSMAGVGDFTLTIQVVKNSGLNRRLKFLGLLPNSVKTISKLQQGGLEALQATKNIPVLPFVISDRVAVTEAATAKKPVWYKPKDAGHKTAANEMRAACEYILKEVLS